MTTRGWIARAEYTLGTAATLGLIVAWSIAPIPERPFHEATPEWYLAVPSFGLIIGMIGFTWLWRIRRSLPEPDRSTWWRATAP